MISAITLKNISKRYRSGNFTLHIGDLEFTNRDIHVVIGANGSGKTTLLKLIAFLDKPDGGEMFFDGKNIPFFRRTHNRLRRKIGFVMQNPYLFNMSAFENVALGLKIRKRPKAEIASKVRNILSVLKIGHLAGQNVKLLSRGEYQKVAIAQVLVLEPEIIMMDEPSANVDHESTLSIERILRSVRERQKSIIIITTHSGNQAGRLSRHIVSIKNGRLEGVSYEDLLFEGIKDLPRYTQKAPAFKAGCNVVNS